MATANSDPKATDDVVLSRPLQLDDPNSAHRRPTVARLFLNLFKNVRPGANLTTFHVPAIFNLPKSQLQCYGESVYSFQSNMLKACNEAPSPAERLAAAVGWSLSNLRPLGFGVAPYNPVLGETHHVSNGSLNVLIEQVSHHPPITALHATDESEMIETVWCVQAVPRFSGTAVEVEMKGQKTMKLMKHGETYSFRSPNLGMKFFPPEVDWVGDDRISCQETGLQADLRYSTSSFFRRRASSHAVNGRIYEVSSSRTIMQLYGHWNSIVMAKEVSSGKERVIYNAKEAIVGLKSPIVRDREKVRPSESAKVWAKVSKGIMSKEWDNAREAKTALEITQRKLAKERALKAQQWIPQHFSLHYNEEDGWGCTPLLSFVPPAPIVVPLNL